MDLDSEIDALFALPAHDFTAARNALAKRLRAADRRDDAAAVGALRRPTLPAWAVNQLARRSPERIDALLAAGRELAQAQRRLLSGVRDAGLREASDRRRERIAALTDEAAAILAEVGADAGSHRRAIANTLEAASVDPRAGDPVRAGRLHSDLPPPSDFGAVEGLALLDAPLDGQDADPTGADEEDGALALARRDVEEAQARLEQARVAQDAAAETAAGARRRAIAAGDEADRLERRAEAARRKAQEAEADARRAEERRRTTGDTVGELEAALDARRADLDARSGR